MAKKKMLKNHPGFDEWLRFAYCDKHKTMAQIAAELQCSPVTVLNHLRRCGIETRKKSDYETSERVREAWRKLGAAQKGHKRTDYEFGGHEKKRRDGYIKVYVPDHPHSTADGYVMKHTLVMEREIGRYLNDDEVVHHKHHIRDDNRIENLQLMNVREHMSMHMKERHQKGA